MHTQRLQVALALLLCLAPLASRAVDPEWDRTRALARELVSLMKLDEQAVQKTEALILARCRRESCDADLRQCLMKSDREYFAEDFAREARNALSPEEMQQAIDYFRTEAGLRHLDILRAEQGLGGGETLFNQSDETRRRILAFLDTRAGYLLITRSVLTLNSSQLVGWQADDAFWRCQPRK
jgi:hypothetical protein